MPEAVDPTPVTPAAPSDGHVYDDAFYDYIGRELGDSARKIKGKGVRPAGRVEG